MNGWTARTLAACLPLAASLLLAASLTACTGGESGTDAPRSATTLGTDPTEVQFEVLSFDLDAAAPSPPGLADDVRTRVLATLDAYLRAATLDPARGQPAGDLNPLFTAAAAARLSGPDRATLVDDRLPPSSEVAPVAKVGLRGLVGRDGTPAVMAAQVDVQLTGELNGQPLSIVRQGTLVLVDEGGWKIDGYDLRVVRDVGPSKATISSAEKSGPS